MVRREVAKGTSAREMQWYEQFRECQKNGVNLAKTRTFIGKDGKVCETKLPITERTVFVESSVLDERAQKAKARQHEDDLARAQRGLATRDRNTTLSTTKDMAMVVAIAGAEVDVKV